MAENNIASNEAQLNQNNLTSDFSNTNGTNADVNEISSTWTSPIASITNTPAPPANTTAEVTPTAVPTAADANAEAIATNKKTQDELKAEAEKRAAEDLAIKEERIADATKTAESKDIIVSNKQVAIDEVTKEASQFSTDTTKSMVELLEEQKKLALDKANLELEEQKISNKQALEKAEMQVNLEEQKASWSMNKLGLGFSAGIIQEVQAIATRGATEIAKLKITAKKAEVDTSLQISRLEYDYSKDINTLISSNLNTQLTLKEKTANLIADTQNNLLLNETEKASALTKIKEEFINATRANEDNIRTEQERLANKYVDLATNYQTAVTQQENITKEKLNTSFVSGAYYNLSTAEKSKMATAAGMTIGEVEALADNQVQTKSYETATKIMGDSFLFTQAENDGTISTIKRLLSSGLGLEQATQRAVANTLRGNPEYQRLQKILDLEAKNTISGLTTPRWGSSGGGSSIKATQYDAPITWPDGISYHKNKSTWVYERVLFESTTPSLMTQILWENTYPSQKTYSYGTATKLATDSTEDGWPPQIQDITDANWDWIPD